MCPPLYVRYVSRNALYGFSFILFLLILILPIYGNSGTMQGEAEKTLGQKVETVKESKGSDESSLDSDSLSSSSDEASTDTDDASVGTDKNKMLKESIKKLRPQPKPRQRIRFENVSIQTDLLIDEINKKEHMIKDAANAIASWKSESEKLESKIVLYDQLVETQRAENERKIQEVIQSNEKETNHLKKENKKLDSTVAKLLMEIQALVGVNERLTKEKEENINGIESLKEIFRQSLDINNSQDRTIKSHEKKILSLEQQYESLLAAVKIDKRERSDGSARGITPRVIKTKFNVYDNQTGDCYELCVNTDTGALSWLLPQGETRPFEWGQQFIASPRVIPGHHAAWPGSSQPFTRRSDILPRNPPPTSLFYGGDVEADAKTSDPRIQEIPNG